MTCSYGCNLKYMAILCRYPVTLFNELYYLNSGGTIWTGIFPERKPIVVIITVAKPANLNFFISLLQMDRPQYIL